MSYKECINSARSIDMRLKLFKENRMIYLNICKFGNAWLAGYLVVANVSDIRSLVIMVLGGVLALLHVLSLTIHV